jgi:hypothetical protein
VPHVPPRFLNYVDHPNQAEPKGNRYEPAGGAELYFFASWLYSLALKQFIANHSMERYRLEVLEAVRTHPRVAQYWRFPDLAQ